MIIFIILCVLAISLATWITTVIAKWRVYEKAGCKGWAALIPFFSTFTLYRVAWGNGWIFLVEFVPLANAVFAILTQIKLAHNFGKGTGYILGLIFLHPFFIWGLGFGKSRYLGVVEDGIFDVYTDGGFGGIN